MLFPSKHIEDAVNQLSTLPGIGRKTALRLALFLLKREPEKIRDFTEALLRMKLDTCFCRLCHNVSDAETCRICSNPSRDPSMLCVVADFRDVIAIENTQSYRGSYHVLGGLISPMDGIGPSELNIDSLVLRLQDGEVAEVILALAPTPDGDTTNFFLFRKIKDFPVHVSSLARGISVGDDIEYADEVTLGKSLQNRVPYENSLRVK